jgi:signal transduction histidine kinase
MFWRKYRSPLVLGGTALVYALVPRLLPRGYALTVWGDGSAMLLMLLVIAVYLRNAIRGRGPIRGFWFLLTVASLLWSINQAAWFWWEVVLRKPMPEPFLGDPILFLHVVPFMAAAILLPHLTEANRKLYFGTLNTLTLLSWWVFVYVFVVFPHEFVIVDLKLYNTSFDLLFMIECLLVAVALVPAALSARGRWRQVYFHFGGAMGVYAVGSTALNMAVSKNYYYTGSLFDVPYAVSLAWAAWTGIIGRDLKEEPAPPGPWTEAWIRYSPRLAMVLVMSVPAFGLWTLLFDKSPVTIRVFRTAVTMIATITLGVWVFSKQHLIDIALRRLVREKEDSYEQLARLQGDLVQKEKMAAIGQLAAGAAHEINNPLAAIMGYAEMLSFSPDAGENVRSIAEKIRQQGQRTKALVADLLSFAQQSPVQRTLIDVGALVVRATQAEARRMESANIRVITNLDSALPKVWANANQIFQVFLQILDNAADALAPSHGGAIEVWVWREGEEVVTEISDSGPGVTEPARVFDPFYTTKPVGQGTGLGLSAAYGIVLKHKGQISCHNRPEGGAAFTVRIPVATLSAQAAVAGGSSTASSE